jgi:serine/threonine/tyrosine protein kinase RAD53
LDEYVKEPFSSQELRTILFQSLDTLSTMHENGIAHRDIKPANILVQSRRPLRIKFADFGLSKSTSDLRTECGTEGYWAPAVLGGLRQIYSGACDIWSVAIMVVGLAHGGLPRLDGWVGVPWCEAIIEHVGMMRDFFQK